MKLRKTSLVTITSNSINFRRRPACSVALLCMIPKGILLRFFLKQITNNVAVQLARRKTTHIHLLNANTYYTKTVDNQMVVYFIMLIHLSQGRSGQVLTDCRTFLSFDISFVCCSFCFLLTLP